MISIGWMLHLRGPFRALSCCSIGLEQTAAWNSASHAFPCLPACPASWSKRWIEAWERMDLWQSFLTDFFRSKVVDCPDKPKNWGVDTTGPRPCYALSVRASTLGL